MLPEKMTLEVVTPERKVLSTTIDEAILPGEMGYFGVLPGHTPFLTSLSIGEAMYRIGNQKKFLALNQGFVEVLPEKVILIAETAEVAEEIDIERAMKKKAEAEEVLRLKKGDTHFKVAEVRLKKALTRISVSKKT